MTRDKEAATYTVQRGWGMKGTQHVFHFISGSPPGGLDEQLRLGTNCTQVYHHTCQTARVYRDEGTLEGETERQPHCLLKYMAWHYQVPLS